MGEKTSDYENRLLFEDGLSQRKTKEMMSYLKREVGSRLSIFLLKDGSFQLIKINGKKKLKSR